MPASGIDLDGAGMGAADGDRHAADAHRQRIGAERAAVERLDRHALVEPEMAQAAGIAVAERAQSIGGDARAVTDLELVEGNRVVICD